MTQALVSTAALAALSLLTASSIGLAQRATPAPAASKPAIAGLGALHPIASPAGADSAQPQLAVEGSRAVLSWIERAGTRATLKFSERTAGGWSPARTVASGDDWFVNWADVPSVRPLADGSLAAHWLQKSGADTYAYDVKLSFSRDGGKSWSQPTSPHHDGTKSEHGFASLFQSPGAEGGLGLVWLDGRDMKKAPPKGTPSDPHGNGHTPGAAHNERGAMTIRAGSFAPDGTQRAETLIDDRVCECCPTAAALTADGPIVAFRNRDENEVRNIHVSRLVSGRWTESVAVHDDKWKTPACPVNGPSLSAIGRRVAIAWFTMQDDLGHAYLAFSEDSGRTFGAPIRIDEETTLGRVDVELLPDGSAIVAWIEFAEKRAQLRLRRVSRDGTRAPSTAIAGLGANRTSGYPRLARAGNELLLAWTDTTAEKPRVSSARIALTPAVNRVTVGKAAPSGTR